MVFPGKRLRNPRFSRKDCQSMASTSVVFPWSTWATIATLRMCAGSGTRRG
jgi:hypothetical protein